MFVLESYDNSSDGTTLYRAALPVLTGLGSSPTSIALANTVLPLFAMASDLTVKSELKRIVVNGEKPSNTKVEKKPSVSELVLSPYATLAETFERISAFNSGKGLKDKPVRHHNVFGAGKIAFIGDAGGDISIENWVPVGTLSIGGVAYPTHKQEHRRSGSTLRSGLAGCLIGNVSGAYSNKRTYNGDFVTVGAPFGAVIYRTAEGVNHLTGRNDAFGSPAGQKSYEHYGFQGVTCGPLNFVFTHETGNCYWGTTVDGYGTETVHSDGYIRRYRLAGTAVVVKKYSNPSYLVLQWTITSTRETLTLGPTGFNLSYSVETETLTKVSYAIACSPLGATRSSSLDSLTETGLAVGGVVRTIWRDLDSAPPSCAQIDAEKDALDSAVKLLSSNWIENVTQTGAMLRNLVASFAGVTLDFLDSAQYNQPLKFLAESRAAWKGLTALSGARKLLVWSAKLYLLWRYVYKPTIKDCREVEQVVANWRKSKLRPESHVARGKVEGSSEFNGLLIKEQRWSKLSFSSPITSDQVDLYSLGLAPTLANLWDLIPFSFVLDWATNFNVLLDRIDFAVINRNYHIHYNTAGMKRTTEIECNTHPLLSFLGIEGTMKVTSYSRDVLFGTSSIAWSLSSRPAHQWASAGTALALVLLDKPITALQQQVASLNDLTRFHS